eukprot:SAG31_NODE_4103_length_3579_cov_2.836494_6_plen_70_part_01
MAAAAAAAPFSSIERLQSPLLRGRENLILVPIVTPLTRAGQLDVASLGRYIRHLYACGVAGLYIAGSSGE